jgi:hypothetical protein
MGTGWGINNRDQARVFFWNQYWGQALIKAGSGLVKFDIKGLRASFIS